MSRSYSQFCGLARALDVIGDRWSLLIVRQLLVAPARYTDLHAGLPGIATNLLVDRLRHLEESGVVERSQADRGGAVVYGLTPWGAELRGPIEGLVRWSTPLMARGPEGDHFRLEWLAVALPALLAGRRAPGTIGIAVDGDVLRVRSTSRGIEVAIHDSSELAGVLHADAWVVLGVASGALTLDEGVAHIEGDRNAVRTFFNQASAARPAERDPE